MLYLTILLAFLFFAGVAMTVYEGMWNNAIALFSILLGGLFAVFGGVPFGNWIAEQADKGAENHWYFVFAGMWGVFALSLLVIRLVAERASRTRMKFIPLIDKIGGPILGVLVAIMFTSFAAYTLERVPIKAGVWKFSDAAEWQTNAFTWARAPFWNVVDAAANAEEVNSPFLKN